MNANPEQFVTPFAEVFTDDFTKRQIEWYGVKQAKHGAVEIVTKELVGRIDDYLSNNYRAGGIHAPVLSIDGQLWMSLTPMEIQSAEYALSQAEGKVATAGLGMGYFTLRAAESDLIESVDVYEINPDIIKFFNEEFQHREGFDKINIIEGDVRQNMYGKVYDLVFNDIYQTMLPDEVTEDIESFTENNSIETYMFWGYELAIWSAAQQELFGDGDIEDVHIEDISIFLREYFRGFMADDQRTGLAKTGWDLPPDDYLEPLIRAMYDANENRLP